MRERIQKFIDYKGMTPGDLATVLEVQRSNISHILNGRNRPGALFIEKFLNVFPEVNARWLLTGKGEMMTSGIGEKKDPGKGEITTSLISEKMESGKGEMIVSAKDEDDNKSKENSEVRSEPVITYRETKKKESPKQDVISVILLHSDGTFTNYNAR